MEMSLTNGTNVLVIASWRVGLIGQCHGIIILLTVTAKYLFSFIFFPALPLTHTHIHIHMHTLTDSISFLSSYPAALRILARSGTVAIQNTLCTFYLGPILP